MAESASLRRPKSVPPTAPPARAIGDQLLDEVWVRSRSSLPISVLVFLIAWPIARETVSTSRGALAAYVAFIGIALARWTTALWAIPRLDRLAVATKRWVAVAGAFANGCAFGAMNAYVCFHTDPIGLGLWLAIIVGLTGGAAVSLGARPEVFAAYTVPTISALVVASLVSSRSGMTSLAVCFSLWIVYSLAQVMQYRRSRVEFLTMNLALDENVRELNGKNALLQEKNVALEEMTQRANRIFSALAETLPGRTLASRYKLESRIGSGGFSIVFRALHVEIQRYVAVKIFRPQPGNDSAAALERFRFEGAASSRTRHPNLVEVLDAGISDDGIPFIAMELLDGHSLDVELKEGVRLPICRVNALIGQACHGLAAAHAAGVIHRDVKPENIFLHHEGDREIVKVLDFGIAKVIDTVHGGTPDMTGSGALLGTPHYMAPERFLGQPCGESADAYSIGIILYRALSGELPYKGTVGEIMIQAVARRPPDLRSLAPEVPRALAEVIMASLDDDPTVRPTVTRIADALEAEAHRAETAA
jgi:hypothetical protein